MSQERMETRLEEPPSFEPPVIPKDEDQKVAIG